MKQINQNICDDCHLLPEENHLPNNEFSIAHSAVHKNDSILPQIHSHVSIDNCSMRYILMPFHIRTSRYDLHTLLHVG